MSSPLVIMLGACPYLQSVEVNSVTSIGNRAFTGCTTLKEVICCAQTPPSAVTDSFDESTYKDATLYVPVGYSQCLLL